MYDVLKTDPCSQVYKPERQTVVIVDSDGSQLFYMSILLERLDFCIRTFKSAEEALDTIAIVHPALVLTEISFSGMNGVEFLKKIKRNPLTHSVPVIIITSLKNDVVKGESLREGCDAYLAKPVDGDILYLELQKVLGITARQFIRLQTKLNVIVGDEPVMQNSVISDYVTALSEQGMYISTSTPKPAGSHVPITILLGYERIKLEGLVLYSFSRESGPLKTPGMGIKFVSIPPEDRRLIKSFIKREIAKKMSLT